MYATMTEMAYTAIDNAQWVALVEDYHLCGRCGTAMQLDHAGPFAYWFCLECGHETEVGE